LDDIYEEPSLDNFSRLPALRALDGFQRVAHASMTLNAFVFANSAHCGECSLSGPS
jgi:hypothetical protein